MMSELWQELIPACHLRRYPNLKQYLTMIGGHCRAAEIFVQKLLARSGRPSSFKSSIKSTSVKAASDKETSDKETSVKAPSWDDLKSACRDAVWLDLMPRQLWEQTCQALLDKYAAVASSRAEDGLLAAVFLNAWVTDGDTFDSVSVDTALGTIPIAFDSSMTKKLYRLRVSVAAMVMMISNTGSCTEPSGMSANFRECLHTLIGMLVPDATAVDGASFERITAQFLAVQKFALAELQRSAPGVFERYKLRSMFRSGLYTHGCESWKLPSPIVTPEDSEAVEQLSSRFPGTALQPPRLHRLTGGETVFINASGAPFADVFTYLVPTSGSSASIRLWVQCKAYQKSVVRINSSDTGGSVAAEVAKVQSKLATVPAPASSSGATVRDVFLLFSFGRLHGAAGDPDDVRRREAGAHIRFVSCTRVT
jgi:hypothetical protein